MGVSPPKFNQASAGELLTNAYTLLRPGGALLLGFPLTEGGKEHISLTELCKLAPLAGFDPKNSRIHIGTSNIARPALPAYGYFVK